MATQGSVSLPKSSPSAPPKRVLPARERRESATKREASSPVSITKTAPPSKRTTQARTTPKTTPLKSSERKALPETTPPRRSTAQIIEDLLPTTIVDTKPLPTSYQPQSGRLSAEDYQSIAESAVLSASLYRSRTKWLAEGIFEKYWTKPSKRKGTEALARNPDLKTMQRLGSSKITIGPHTVDATIYTVRESTGYRHPNQYAQRPVAPQPGFQNYQPVASQAVTPQSRPLANQVPHTPPPQIKQEVPLSGPSTIPLVPIPKVSRRPQPQPPTSPPSRPSASQAGPDPVIRMLATRAATNPDLKALMKVVASSKASQEQLKLFQSHIDELNGIIRQQQTTEKAAPILENAEAVENRPRPPLDGADDTTFQPVHRAQDGNQRLSHPPHTFPPANHLATQTNSAIKYGPLGPPANAPAYTHYPPPQPKLPMPEPRIQAIVLEFATPASATVPASQDRYLFPECAVLDTPLSGRGLEMVCSFLVVRKGSDLLAVQSAGGLTTVPVGGLTQWKENEEYYQPVTMIIKAPQHRILETIARAAKPLGEVQRTMKEIMESKIRVLDEWLITRLPREKGVVADTGAGLDAGFVDSAVEIDEKGASGDEDDELNDFYGI